MPMDYAEPDWASAPRSDFYFEVLKGGVIIENIKLDERSFYILGRQPDTVHFQLDHPSISRQHAILQYGQSESSLYIYDGGSTHGTFINKQRISTKEYVKLNVGDVIRFGESTRLYILCGPEELKPEEYDSKNLQEYRLKKQLRNQLIKKADDTKDVEDIGISWGFDDDAINEEDEKSDSSEKEEADLPEYLKTEAQKSRRKDVKVDITEDAVHAKDRKAFQSLQMKLQKIENLHTENERITAKESTQGGLTPGQQQQVDRNMQRLVQLREQVEAIQDSIHQKNLQRTGPVDAKDDTDMIETEDVNDEFFDRTLNETKKVTKYDVKARRFKSNKPVKGILVASRTSTYDSLLADQKELQNKLCNIISALKELDNEEYQSSSLENGNEELDPLDAFLISNENDSRNERRQELLKERDGIEAELRKTSALIKLAQPSLPSLKANINSAPTGLATCFSIVKRENDLNSSESPISKRVKWAEVLKEEKIIECRDSDKEIECKEPFFQIASSMKTKRKVPLGPSRNMEVEIGVWKDIDPDEKIEDNGLKRHITNSDVDEIGREETWVPPSGQTGDGRTDLNIKLGY